MKFFALLLLFLFPILPYAHTLSGKVVRIADGDTITLLLVDHTSVKVRLYGIDCPERGQAFGKVATDYTREFCAGKSVTVEQQDIDRYGRIVGTVRVGDKLLNTALLQAGLAWHYKQYDKNKQWAALEDIARKNKVGLWQEQTPVAPWQWRKEKGRSRL